MSLKFLEQVFLGNRILDYLIALTALVGGLLFVKLVVIAVVRHLKKAAEKTVTMFDDLLVEIIEKIVLPGFISVVSIWALRFLIFLRPRTN